MSFFKKPKKNQEEKTISLKGLPTYKVESLDVAFAPQFDIVTARNPGSLEMSDKHKYERMLALFNEIMLWGDSQNKIKVVQRPVSDLLDHDSKSISTKAEALSADLLILKADILKDGKPDGSHYLIYTQNQELHDVLFKMFSNRAEISIRKFDAEFEFYSELKPQNMNKYFIPIKATPQNLIRNIVYLHIESKDHAPINQNQLRKSSST